MAPNESVIAADRKAAKPGFEELGPMNNNTVSYLRPVVSKDGPINVLSENWTKHDEKETNEQEINHTNIEIKNTGLKNKKSERYQGG
jgi:hypothetical protein